jgi:hypothetical protein
MKGNSIFFIYTTGRELRFHDHNYLILFVLFIDMEYVRLNS